MIPNENYEWMKFGMRVHRNRHRLGQTLVVAAEEIGCHMNTLARLERGELGPPRNIAYRRGMEAWLIRGERKEETA